MLSWTVKKGTEKYSGKTISAQRVLEEYFSVPLTLSAFLSPLSLSLFKFKISFMPIIADLHVHSKYAQAVSPRMSLFELQRQAEMKGIDVIGTGDFTHPLHFKAIKTELEPAEPGLLKYRGASSKVRFMLTTEICNIFYSKTKQEKRIHSVVLAPSLDCVRKINLELAQWGHLEEDGRPTFRRHVKDLVRFLRLVDPDILCIPAHLWTPWYSLFGSNFGFNSLEECFEEETPYIHAIETGLDSDPAMNRRVPQLDDVACVSFSDAHSPEKVGREATVFGTALNYHEMIGAIREKNPEKLLYTIEVDSRYGKYYWDGHRKCGTVMNPAETRNRKYLCPVCRQKVTVGVQHRVEALAQRTEEFTPPAAIPFRTVLPLQMILADALGKETQSKTVEQEYGRLTAQLGTEFDILLTRTEGELQLAAHPLIAEAILAVREKNYSLEPGYDGLWGKPFIIPAERRRMFARPQMEMF